MKTHTAESYAKKQARLPKAKNQIDMTHRLDYIRDVVIFIGPVSHVSFHESTLCFVHKYLHRKMFDFVSFRLPLHPLGSRRPGPLRPSPSRPGTPGTPAHQTQGPRVAEARQTLKHANDAQSKWVTMWGSGRSRKKSQ